MIGLPVKVLLRDKQLADVVERTNVGPEFAPTKMLVGRNATGGLDMWFTNGKWRENGQQHPNDIVGFVNPDGSLRPLTNEFAA